MDLVELNRIFAKISQQERIHYGLSIFPNSVVTSRFGKYSAAILHMIVQVSQATPVIFIDTGKYTPQTYQHRDALQRSLNLLLYTYLVPSGGTKINALESALIEHNADGWVSGVMRHETLERKNFSYLMHRDDKIVKIHPILDWSDQQAQQYIHEHRLPLNADDRDPDKTEGSECGIHLSKMPSANKDGAARIPEASKEARGQRISLKILWMFKS